MIFKRVTILLILTLIFYHNSTAMKSDSSQVFFLPSILDDPPISIKILIGEGLTKILNEEYQLDPNLSEKYRVNVYRKDEKVVLMQKNIYKTFGVFLEDGSLLPFFKNRVRVLFNNNKGFFCSKIFMDSVSTNFLIENFDKKHILEDKESFVVTDLKGKVLLVDKKFKHSFLYYNLSDLLSVHQFTKSNEEASQLIDRRIIHSTDDTYSYEVSLVERNISQKSKAPKRSIIFNGIEYFQSEQYYYLKYSDTYDLIFFSEKNIKDYIKSIGKTSKVFSINELNLSDFNSFDGSDLYSQAIKYLNLNKEQLNYSVESLNYIDESLNKKVYDARFESLVVPFVFYYLINTLKENKHEFVIISDEYKIVIKTHKDTKKSVDIGKIFSDEINEFKERGFFFSFYIYFRLTT